MKHILFFSIPVLLIFLSGCTLSSTDELSSVELSGVTVTSSSFRDETDTVYQGDEVYLAIGVADNDNIAHTLNISVTNSTGTEVASLGIGNFAIYNNTIWKANFSTEDMEAGSYTINIYATDDNKDNSNTVTGSFEIQTDPGGSLTVADLAISITSWKTADSTEGEPFRIVYQIGNSSSVLIDQIFIPFEIWDGTTLLDRTTGIVTALAAGETRTDIEAKALIPISQSVTAVNFNADDVLIQFY